MIDALDENAMAPDQFLKDSFGNVTTEINPAFLSWKNHEQALFTFLNSTLSPSILAIIVGQKSGRGVWKVLEKHFALVSRSSVMSLRNELNSINGADHHRDRRRHSHRSSPIITDRLIIADITDRSIIADYSHRSISPRSSPIIDLATLITDHQPRQAHRSSPIIAPIDLATLIADHHRYRPRHVVTHSADLPSIIAAML
nr:hypothetical protein CFP56_76897 [Quercus suber]